MSMMRNEIAQQPDAIRTTVRGVDAAVTALVAELRLRSVRHVILAARGTSDNAAVYAKYLFEIVVQVSAALAAPSVFTLYNVRPSLADCLVIGISQSGQATDVVEVLAAARASGALTASITNVEGAPIAAVSDFSLLTQCGPERAVAATKTYTTTLAVVALLAARWAADLVLEQQIEDLPQQIVRVLDREATIGREAKRLADMTECAVLARGVNLPTALETALKMTETGYVAAKPFSAADFMHGPIAMVSEGFPCLLFAPNGRALVPMRQVALRLQERGAQTIVIAEDSDILETATVGIPLDTGVQEMLSPIVYIVAGQLWAYHLAVARGLDPDAPRGLSKVTLTR